MTRISINLIRRLERLSDYNRLKYEWIDNLGDIVTSYDDDYYDLFSSTGVSSALEENLVVFGPDGLILKKGTKKKRRLPGSILRHHERWYNCY